MKTIYATLFAVFVGFTANAQQLLNESFSSRPIDSRITMEFTGNSWSYELAASNPVPAEGNYVINGNGNGIRVFTVKVNTTSGVNKNNKLTLSWLERKTDNTSGEIIERIVSYRIVGSTDIAFKAFESESSIPFSETWNQKTAILHDDNILEKEVELQFYVKKTEGNKAKYAIDNLSVAGSFEPIIQAPLPVELSSFQGQALKGAAKLAWTTASEKNNEKFMVERSQDGKSFSAVGEVKGSGNSATKRSYSFSDNASADGINYYRLRQVDTDGTETLSNVIALEVAGGSLGATVYPTEASSKAVTISLQNVKGNATISVVDATGRPVATFTNTTAREIELPVHNLRSGMYFVRVTDGQSQQVQRFIKK